MLYSEHFATTTNINHPLPHSSASADDAPTLSVQLTPQSSIAVTAQPSVAPLYPPPASVVQPQRTKQRQPPPMLGSQASSQPAFLEGSRSPPSKNLSHVPCKFFRQGTCQAGNTCPFSHSMDSQLEQAPCKYFQKGNCKFGAKCALAHILPDGRRVNHRSLSQNYGPLQLGARNILPDLNTNSYSNNPSALARSLIAQHNGQPAQQTAAAPAPPSSTQPLDIPEFGFEYGASPPTENFMSPSSARTLGPLDVPMPASLDSNGISFLARHGPIAASVPAKFGSLEASPPPSLPHQQNAGGVDLNALSSSHTLRSLYMSAFGVDSEHGLSSFVKTGAFGGRAGFASPGPDEPASPPAGTNTTIASATNNTSGVAPRLNNMSHSPFGLGSTANPSSGLAGRRYVSSSFPARSSIWRGTTNIAHDEDEFYPSANGSYHTSNADSFLLDDSASNIVHEEDFVPSSLNELLTPQERHRRGSRHDDNFHNGEYSSSISGRLGSTGTIGDGIVSSSPRGNGFGESPRFGQLFNGHHHGGLVANNPNSNNVSAIGSPLRYSSHGTPSMTATTGADTNGASAYFLSTSPLATSKKFTGGTVQRTPSGRRVVSPSTLVIEEDDEEDGSHHNTHNIPKSEEDDNETQFIMDEEQLDHGANSNGSRRSLIDGGAETGDSLNGVDAVEGKLNGLVLSR
ncbi:hypothetical protein V1509DRAFT_651116 [Lipomyces kononenkoae]